jgi:hypothetical protein
MRSKPDSNPNIDANTYKCAKPDTYNCTQSYAYSNCHADADTYNCT